MRVVIVAILLVSTVLATSKAQAEAATHLDVPDNLTASAFGPKIVADYSASMLHYRTSLSTHLQNGLIGDFVSSMRIPWAWRSDDGSTVRRIGDRLFLLTQGDCLSRMCQEVYCQQTEWPVFDCRDGHKRKMAAPGPSDIIFDGISYSQIGSPQF
ncbi:hypothetical protein NKH57_26960 [Mesorhizobium sp. M1050]|uniref:hypothetical protein n=1 Tax=unclassified Mesorhizobium TaxID=325217 RepID=UPI003339F144